MRVVFRRGLILVSTALLFLSAAPVGMRIDMGACASIARPASSAQPEDWASKAQLSISKREYEATDAGAGLQAPNRALGLRTYFEPAGARIVDRDDEASELMRLHTVGVGRGGEERAPSGALEVDGARVELRRAGIVEWYENAETGIEQGWTLTERPTGEGALAIEIDLGGATASIDGDHASVVTAGDLKFEYGALSAKDSNGAVLAARMESASAGRVRLVVDDSTAIYPITVDPTLTQPAFATLMADQASAAMGYSVAGAGDVNNDGFDDVIVGAGLYDAGQTDEGAAFIYLGGPNGIASGGPAAASARLSRTRQEPSSASRSRVRGTSITTVTRM